MTAKGLENARRALIDAQLQLDIARKNVSRALELLEFNDPFLPELPSNSKPVLEFLANENRDSPREYHDHKKAIEIAPPQEELTINDEWKAVLENLNHGTNHLFITGNAGTGKTTLEQYFVANYSGVAAIIAPTGVAALRAGGMTIHKFFGFGAHVMEDDDIRHLDDSRRAKYRALDTLVIDEISMVRADLMDAIDLFMRKNGRDPLRPFGGCRVVMFGDLFQLPPVSKEKDEKKYLINKYGTDTPYFFHAEVWRNAPLQTLTLTTTFRQKDPVFTAALNEIRDGKITPPSLNLINSRVNYTFKPPVDEVWLSLTTTNAVADQANQRMLAEIREQSRIFTADVIGEFDLRNAPTDERLELKPGAAVMFVRNSPDHYWVNGTLGKVVQVNPSLIVEIKDEEFDVFPEIWEQIEYNFDEKTKRLKKKVKGEFHQIPLKLAAAITIHKAQGLSLDRAIVDLSFGAFAAGQCYVAISRLRTLEGLILRRPIKEKDLITSTEVVKFMRGEPIAKPNGQLSLLEQPK